MAFPSPNIVTNQVSTKERWLKLYRKIHNMFLKDEFIHIVDYNKMVTEMNARFAELETKLTAELTKVQVGLATHIHNAPQAPAGTLPTTPPILPLPPYQMAYAPTKPIVPVTTAMQQTDLALQATGPGVAPLGDGLSVTAELASTTAISDIGV